MKIKCYGFDTKRLDLIDPRWKTVLKFTEKGIFSYSLDGLGSYIVNSEIYPPTFIGKHPHKPDETTNQFLKYANTHTGFTSWTEIETIRIDKYYNYPIDFIMNKKDWKFEDKDIAIRNDSKSYGIKSFNLDDCKKINGFTLNIVWLDEEQNKHYWRLFYPILNRKDNFRFNNEIWFLQGILKGRWYTKMSAFGVSILGNGFNFSNKNNENMTYILKDHTNNVNNKKDK